MKAEVVKRELHVEATLLESTFDTSVKGDSACLVRHLQSFAKRTTSPHGKAVLELFKAWIGVRSESFRDRNFGDFLDWAGRELLTFVESIVPLYDHPNTEIPVDAGILTDKPDRPRNVIAAMNYYCGLSTKRSEFLKAMGEFGRRIEYKPAEERIETPVSVS